MTRSVKPKPLLCFAQCDCVKKGACSIQGLFFKSFDGKWLRFKMRCLYCNVESSIKESIDEIEIFRVMEAQVEDYLQKQVSDFLLVLCLEGKTISISQKNEEEE